MGCACCGDGAAVNGVAAADFDLDGRRDLVATKLNVEVTIYGSAETNPCSVDFNADGFLEFTDFDSFVGAFESGC